MRPRTSLSLLLLALVTATSALAAPIRPTYLMVDTDSATHSPYVGGRR